jgi:4-hydroxy-tetrahydrodipicolinate reductase
MAIRIGIGGIGGRMGREIAAAAVLDPALELIGGVETGPRPDLGAGIEIGDDLNRLLPHIDVLIDFTTPAATVENVEAAAAAGVAAVSGVTGLSEEQLTALRRAGARAPVFYSRNMSVGINALVAFLPQLVQALDDYDIEIVELHHRHKVDAPSGTALVLAEAIAAARDVSLSDTATYGRHGVAPRQHGEIGIHALRGGGNTGEHTVLFADEGEEIQIVHRALSRKTFALGALRAAKFVLGQAPGFYGMEQMLTRLG